MITRRRGTIFFSLLTIVIVFIFSADFLSDRVFCYDTNVAHPHIAELAGQLYNQYFSNGLSKKDLECILKGAREEDTPTRWLNHFYDPIYNQGLKAMYLSAKDWAVRPNAQASFALGDKTWQRALQDYKDGDRDLALMELGHVLHLVADMAVPAHTRDDIHVYPGDSYEQYLKNNWSEAVKEINFNQLKIKDINNLNQAFDELASYSNNNFYSDDTIEDKKYKIIKVEKSFFEKIGNINYEFFENSSSLNRKNILFSGGVYFDWYSGLSSFKNKGFISVDFPVILKNHTHLLVPQAVSYSAGVIKLFFTEAEKLANAEKQKLPLFRQNLSGLADLFVGKVIQGAQSLLNRFKNDSNNKEVFGEEIPVIMDQDLRNIEQVDAQKTISPYQGETKRGSVAEETMVPVVVPLVALPVIVAPAPAPVVPPVVTPIPIVYYGGGGGGGSSSVGSPNQDQDSTPTPTSTIPVETPTSTSTTTPEIVTPTSTPETPTSTLPIETPTSTPTSTLPIETATSSVVVINEIAWAGTGVKTANDEWIELYNNTNQTINLAGWVLDVSGRIINLSGNILAHDYYLMERTSDNTVKNITADLIFTLSGGLHNNGENLILKNNSGEIVDQVNCGNGWFFGTDGSPSLAQNRYRTMEKISSNNSGAEPTNWRTNIGYPVLGKNNFGAGDILGTPRQANNNYWVLKSLTYYYSNQISNNTLYLTKEHSPYIFDYNLEIPSGYKVIVEPGVVLVGLIKDSYINILGELQINGTEQEPVIITSARDTEKISRAVLGWSDLPQTGDWSRLEVNSGGKLAINYANLYYGGAIFKKGTGWVYGTTDVSQVIRNTGGEAKIENSYFFNSFVSPEDSQYNAVVWTENLSASGVTTIIKNNTFNGGWTAIKNFGQNNGTKIYSEITGNTFNNFLGENGPVVLKYFLPTLGSNTFSGNNKDSVHLDCLEMPGDVKLEKGTYVVSGAVTVPVNQTLTLSSGANFVMKDSADVIVNGILYANGSETEPINFNSEEGYAWGKIIFNPGSSGVLNYTYLRDGGMTNLDPSVSGIVMADNAVLNFNNILFSDSQRPQNMVYLKDSNTKIKDSKISWNSEFSSPTRSINGISAIGGTLDLDNVYFDQMDIGINSLADFIFKSNMEDEHFTNIKKYNWWPEDLFNPVITDPLL